MSKLSILTVFLVVYAATFIYAHENAAFAGIGEPAAQTHEAARPFRVGVSLGYSFAGYREETYSPVNRYLNTLTFLIDGNIDRGSFFHSFNLSFFMGNSQPAIPAGPVLTKGYDQDRGEAYYRAVFTQFSAVRAYLEYALNHRFWGNDIFPGYLGGAFRMDAYLQFAFYPSITGIFSVGLHVTQKWNIDSRNSLIFSAGVPIFGYAVRPAYAGADGALLKYAGESPLRIITLGQITGIHNHWALFGNLKYHHRVSPLISLYSGLGFELSRINFPRPRADAIFRLSSGIAFRF